MAGERGARDGGRRSGAEAEVTWRV
jgi:hypothetical protein